MTGKNRVRKVNGISARNNGQKKLKKYGGRKIKIRLADPNIPDSYICELFDTSYEDEESDYLEDQEFTKLTDESKPKNYFEVLMSKESRRHFKCNSVNNNENLLDETKLRTSNSEGTLKKRKSERQKSKETLHFSTSSGEKTFDYEDGSSSDENLLQVQRKCKFKDNNAAVSSSTPLSNKMKSNKIEILSEHLHKIFDSPKVGNISKKKNLNILNYFSKAVTVSKKKPRTRVKSNKVEEIINIVESPSHEKKSDKKVVEVINIVESPPHEKRSDKKVVEVINIEESPPHEKRSDKKVVEVINIEESPSHEKRRDKKVLEVINIVESPSHQKRGDKKVVSKNLKGGLNHNKENNKLAPLFLKNDRKVIDASAQKARLEFLYREIPTYLKKSDSYRNIENSINFPSVSHVQQRNDSVCWLLREIHFPFPLLPHAEENILTNKKKFCLSINRLKAVNINNCTGHNGIELNKEFLNRIKNKYVNLNLNSVIDGLKEKRDKFVKRIDEIEKYRILREKSNLKKSSNDEPGFEVTNTLWIDKYKPTSREILGNENVVNKLRKWLEAWKTFDKELNLAKAGQKLRSTKERNEDDDDDDDNDFLDSDEENYGLKTPRNVCLLYGPHGCGKTSLVLALASELEFNVLEVNASSKRTGRKVLSDLQEATQSHKVHHGNLLQKETFVKKVRKKKNAKRKKKKNIKDSTETPSHVNDCKISLIVIEDADIVFEEHDEGFFSAIACLVQSSKRPLIFLTNDPTCVHLENFRTEHCLVLEMERPDFYSSCAVVDVVSLLEGVQLDKEVLESLVRENAFDLRKCLLELQFLIQSGENTMNCLQTFDLGQLWWGLSKFLYQKDIKHFVKLNTCKRKRSNDLYDSSSEEEVATKKLKLSNLKTSLRHSSDTVISKSDSRIYSYLSVLDMVSTLDTFRLSYNEEPIPAIEYKPKDSLSLEENMDYVSWAETNLTENLFSDAVNLFSGIFAKNFRENKNDERKMNFVSPSWEEFRWRKSQEEASSELMVLVPLHNRSDKKSVHLDYLPMIRSICRLERDRMLARSKRKSRFYHYLNHLGCEPKEENLEINCQVFSF